MGIVLFCHLLTFSQNPTCFLCVELLTNIFLSDIVLLSDIADRGDLCSTLATFYLGLIIGFQYFTLRALLLDIQTFSQFAWQQHKKISNERAKFLVLFFHPRICDGFDLGAISVLTPTRKLENDEHCSFYKNFMVALISVIPPGMLYHLIYYFSK